VFKSCQTDSREEVKAFYKHWRKFAKPVDLGFPGGLGPATFVSFAKGYGVTDLTVELASQLRDLWKSAFPEFQLGFDWISNDCQDPRHTIIGYRADGKPIQGYAYSTPMGAYGAACAFTSAANGSFLQSPTAEAAKLAVFDCVRACRDKSRPNPALGCHPVDFIHDEILFEIPLDGYEQERSDHLCKVMVDAARMIFQNVPVEVEPALSLRWYKEAELTLDAQGRLAVWEPKEKN
jgi:hypothetical protein